MCLLVLQAQAMSSPEELQRRWQVVLSYHGGSAKLWREHLQWQRAQYASFAVPQLRASYQNAVQVGILNISTVYKHVSTVPRG